MTERTRCIGGLPLPLPPSCVTFLLSRANPYYSDISTCPTTKPNPHLLPGSDSNHILVGALVESHLLLQPNICLTTAVHTTAQIGIFQIANQSGVVTR